MDLGKCFQGSDDITCDRCLLGYFLTENLKCSKIPTVGSYLGCKKFDLSLGVCSICWTGYDLASNCQIP